MLIEETKMTKDWAEFAKTVATANQRLRLHAETMVINDLQKDGVITEQQAGKLIAKYNAKFISNIDEINGVKTK